MFHYSSTADQLIPLSLAHKAAEDNSRQALQATWYDAEVLYSSWLVKWPASSTRAMFHERQNLHLKMTFFDSKKVLRNKKNTATGEAAFTFKDPQLSHFKCQKIPQDQRQKATCTPSREDCHCQQSWTERGEKQRILHRDHGARERKQWQGQHVTPR